MWPLTETPYGSKVSTGWSKTTVYRKLNGQSPLDTDEMDALWRLSDSRGLELEIGVVGTDDDRVIWLVIHVMPISFRS